LGSDKAELSAFRRAAATDDNGAAKLSPVEESQLSLPSIPDKPQIGYLWRQTGGESIDELIAMPIFSTETGEVIAAIVLGFRPGDSSGAGQLDAGIKGGIWLGGRLVLPSLDSSSREQIASEVGRHAAAPGRIQGSFEVRAGGAPYLLFYKRLNPDSLYPPASEVILYPLAGLLATQRHLFWQFSGAAGVILLGALCISNFLSGRLSRPVEKLAEDSEENRTQRKRAEVALDLTSRELQRSARFSADASHQLKTPVTVLRAGLEELLAGEDLSPSTREEVSALIHQTFRLTSIVEDLLLLSRLDAGRLQLSFSPVNLRGLIEAGLDDLGTMSESVELQIETDLPPVLTIAGEKRYTSLILQNLLENARKYNRPGGRIRIAAREEGNEVVLTVGNTGRAISPPAQEHIFERFHRGAAGENVPGHGLGLNLARELARIHGGELRLVRSDEDWTEFEVRFRRAGDAAAAGRF
jgi:signal transduction histidine kinase